MALIEIRSRKQWKNEARRYQEAWIRVLDQIALDYGPEVAMRYGRSMEV